MTRNPRGMEAEDALALMGGSPTAFLPINPEPDAELLAEFEREWAAWRRANPDGHLPVLTLTAAELAVPNCGSTVRP